MGRIFYAGLGFFLGYGKWLGWGYLVKAARATYKAGGSPAKTTHGLKLAIGQQVEQHFLRRQVHQFPLQLILFFS